MVDATKLTDIADFVAIFRPGASVPSHLYLQFAFAYFQGLSASLKNSRQIYWRLSHRYLLNRDLIAINQLVR
jgi:hypothetical protein